MAAHLPSIDVGPSVWDYRKTYVFGVVNITPDSFSDGGTSYGLDAAVARAHHLVDHGADAVDLGGESTRPRARKVSLQEELARVLPVIEALAPSLSVPIAIDTYKAETARLAVAAGASIVNDISGGTLDPGIYDVIAETGALYIAGHLRGEPATMQDDIAFDDVVSEVVEELRKRVQQLVARGVKGSQIWVDPSIGFGKTARQSMALIGATNVLKEQLGYPVMIGPSRKSFIGAVTGQPVDERLQGTCAAVAVAIARGADAVRIHDVAELDPAVRVADAIVRDKATEA